MKNTANKATSLQTVAFFVLLFLGMSFKGNAQQVETAAAQTETQNVIVSAQKTAVAAEAASSLNMMSWFMGTKQTPKATITNDAATSSKKQMINAGVAPNRLLIKVFAKKASSFQTAVA